MRVNKVMTAGERLQTVDWPVLREADLPGIEARDCLLVCAGFEDRAVEALRRVRESGRGDFSLGVVIYSPSYQQNKLESILGIGRSARLKTTEFPYDRKDPAGTGERLADFASAFNRVYVDISGMSRLLIVQTLVALLAKKTEAPVTIVYGEAENYPPSKDQFDSDRKDRTGSAPGYLSSGIFEIAATPELASVSMPGEAIRLLAFPSFDPSQLANLLQELQPTYVDLVHGLPPAVENQWRGEAIRTLNSSILEPLQRKYDHEACTRDYRETLKILIEIYQKRSMFDRLVVAPTGSKMQAVAVALFRAVLYDVQVVYPTPQIFTEPDRYTVGTRQLYELDLPTRDIRKILS